MVATTLLGQFASEAVDAYCSTLEADLAGTTSDVALHASHGLTCREWVLTDYARGQEHLVPTDPSVLDALGLELVTGWLGDDYRYAYGAVRIETELTFDPTAAAECFGELASRGLEPRMLGRVPACRRVFDGHLAPGAVCTDDGRCLGDAFCGPRVEADATCTESVCTPRATEGMPCSTDEDECTAGDALGVAHCASSGAGRVCVVDRLQTNIALGQPCGNVGASDRVCDLGLVCFHALGASEPVCVAPIARGRDCRSDPISGPWGNPCEAGSACIQSGAAATCVARRLGRRIGDACGYPAAPATTCDDMARLTCSLDGHCASVGDGTVGSGCRNELSAFDCNAGLRCLELGGVGRCEPEQPAIGSLHAPCAAGLFWAPNCAAGLACATDPSTNVSTCEIYPFGAGLDCMVDADCAPSLSCHATSYVPPWSGAPRTVVCLPKAADGGYCETDVHCASGVCNLSRSICGGVDAGSSCVRDSECLSGQCRSGGCSTDVALGEACDLAHLCPTGSFCPSAGAGSRICTADLGDGSACTESRECVSRRCDVASGTCQPALPLSTSCTAGSDDCGTNRCADTITSPGAYVCAAPPLANGVRCASASDCASAHCVWNAVLSSTFCADAGMPGADCGVDADCLSERCVYDVAAGASHCGTPLPLRAPCRTDAQCIAGVCSLPPGPSGRLEAGRCGDWANVCFAGAGAVGF